MCGIAGAILDDLGEAQHAVARMCAHMVPRGPDDEGIEAVEAGDHAVVLGSRRLAIIDPSPAGHQPMRDLERGTTIVFNGMIYNFRELRRELEAAGAVFSSGCDTEVVLRAYGRWGDACVERFRGMYAFAIWDAKARRLFLARDRLGIKPLYYASAAGRFVFASQVKTLLAGGLVERRLSSAAVCSYLAFGAVSEPATAIEDVLALPAGHIASFEEDVLTVRRYWEPPTEPWRDGLDDAAAELRHLLADTVSDHLISDVPIGVFLSGGLDSSVLAALGARATPHIRTVSVEFDEPEFTESQYMRAVAAHIGSEHVAVRVAATDLVDWLPEAFTAMDQPTFDGINTFVVSRAAAQTGLKVALSGLGADELYDGYGYVRRISLLERVRRLPRPLVWPLPAAAGLFGTRRDKLAYWSTSESIPGSSYALLRGLFLPDEMRSLGSSNGAGSAGPSPLNRAGDLYDQVTALELGHYTKNVLLRDTDSMSMANSLEVRVPYLDHRVVEHALRLPASIKGHRKRILIDAAHGLVPEEVLSRRKHGFLVPFERWLRRELAAEVEQTLFAPPTSVAELVDPEAMTKVWRDFRAGRSNWLRPWALYALCRWAETLE